MLSKTDIEKLKRNLVQFDLLDSNMRGLLLSVPTKELEVWSYGRWCDLDIPSSLYATSTYRLRQDYKEPSYYEYQAEWIKENDIKVGDKVRATRKAKDYENGWGTVWNEYMTVGETLTVEYVFQNGIHMKEQKFVYPWFVLEKVREEKKYLWVVGNLYLRVLPRFMTEEEVVRYCRRFKYARYANQVDCRREDGSIDEKKLVHLK